MLAISFAILTLTLVHIIFISIASYCASTHHEKTTAIKCLQDLYSPVASDQLLHPAREANHPLFHTLRQSITSSNTIDI